QQKLDADAAVGIFNVVRLIEHQQREGAIDCRIADCQVELLWSRHQHVKWRLVEHSSFNFINLNSRGEFLDSNAAGPEVSSQPSSDLRHERPCRRHICDPPLILLELTNRLNNLELSEDRLAGT